MKRLDRAVRLFAFSSNKSPVPRRHPWAIALALPLALMVLLWAATHDLPIAAAASATTYAGCGALNPVPANNFPTIQEAISNTAPSGVVNICPGNYNESVTVNLMNGGSGTGDITVQKNPSAAGIVDWTSTISDALRVTTNFTGNIVLQDLYIHDAQGNGINFATDPAGDSIVITGSVVISNVQAFRNHGNGSFLESGIGVYVHATRGITIFNSTADKNAMIGFALMSEDADAPVYLDHLQANENDLFGILVSHAGAVDLFDSQANENGSLFLTQVFVAAGIIIGPNEGDFLIGLGGLSESLSGVPGAFMAGGEAVLQEVGSPINIKNTEASHNVGFGFIVASSEAPIHFTAATATDNGFDGVAAQVGEDYPAGSIFVDDSTADNNGWYYLLLRSQGVDLTTSGLNGGSSAGFRLSAYQIAIDGASATENQDIGLCLDPYGDGCFSYITNASLTTTGDVTAQNGFPPSMTISNTTANGNPGNGIEIAAADTAVTVTNVTAQANGTGILLNYEALMPKGELVINIPSPIYMPVRIDNSLIQSNTERGIAFEQEIVQAGSLTLIEPVTPTITNNIICENGAGVVISETLVLQTGSLNTAIVSEIGVDARGNWWGNQSGPTPLGSGDSIISGTGVISATPWIDTFFTDAVPNPTIVGIPVDATFRFGDANGAYFLENGVGNLNESPIFHISSDNGDIAAAASIDQFLEDTYLAVTVTPTVTGLVNVNVTGPCGLSPSIAVPVANPSVSVSKSPDLQGVPVGGAAAFTVTIVNTGDITLTEIAVTDTLAPNCGRTSGAINDLGPGLNTSYTCDLTVNNSLVNTVRVDAKALVNGEPAGSGVTNTDTASVQVGSLTLTRTVWVDGYDPVCQTIDKSLVKVPSGTTVKYCFTVTNSGDYTFTTHSLNDSRLGAIFGGFAHDLPPGASYSNIDAGFPATETVTADITGVTTWTGTLDGPIVELTPVSVAAVAQDQVATTVARAVALSQNGDDQDNDGIDDITEGFGDVNANGVPDFLEFTPPTGEEEEDQPGAPQTLLLPSLNR